jgi:SAM-dependent methyltransferase
VIHPDTRVVHISEQVGSGLVATRLLPRGTITWVRDPLDVSWPLAQVLSWPTRDTAVVWRTCLQVNGEVVQPWDNARFMNHACEPNAAGTEFGFEVALRDIQASEELTNDYGSYCVSGEPPFKCACGCGRCRGERVYDGNEAARTRLRPLLKAALSQVANVEQALGDLLRAYPDRLLTAIKAARQAADGRDLLEETWKQVWKRKGTALVDRASYTAADLFAADGFDGALGKTTDASRSHIASVICRALNVAAGRRILEVGCGAGAILSLLQHTGATLCGTDYSPPHIDIARRALPDASFHEAEAFRQPFADASFDAILSHGVFLYFSDLDYAEAVLREMLRVAASHARLLVMDVPDAALRAECEAVRRAAGASLSPKHLYYPRGFFHQFACRHSLVAEISEQEVPDYGNARFRYNVLMRRATEGFPR